MHTLAPSGIGWRHPHYAQLLSEQPALGFLQVHSENFFGGGGAALATLAQARQHYPISLHGVGLSLGSAVGLDTWHLEQLAQLVERVDPVRVSDHACFARATFGNSNSNGAQHIAHAADLLPIPFTYAALNVLCANVQQVQDRLRRSISVENLSAYLHYDAADCSETDFLNTLAQRTGCSILLDVNNIYVNALNEVIAGSCTDPLAQAISWLNALQADCVGELHLAGHCAMDDIVIDDHGAPVCDAVWTLYAHAVQRFGDPAALVEWDTDVPSLAVLLGEAAKADAVRQRVTFSKTAA
jgi:uncharacterized protein